jgi:hypothetical protein
MGKRVSTAVAAGVVALALSVPSIGFANQGGVSHSTKPCPTHKHLGKHNGSGKGKKKGSGKGKKCG